MAENLEIAKAWVQLVPSAKGMSSSIQQAMGNEGADGESIGDGWGEGFAGAAAAAIELAGTALVAAAKEIGQLATEAFNNYAEYEQLTGGIETLFGDSYDTVMEYANNAYATAQMSANDYMELTTAFSASLLSSLGGDTEAAAQYANEAITDMADNANRMGTSMEALENAYRGFARGNYTMLDNLQLGFAGTKEGMEDLLAAATEISGVQYDISSYADIVDAIHVVQDNMGITGATAEEATTTIQGSWNMLSASWQNFLTGMADDTADFDSLCNNLIDSVLAFLGNAIPRIATLLPRLVNGLSELIQALIPEIPGVVGELLPALLVAAVGLVRAIVEAGPELVATLADLIPDIIDAILTMLPLLLDAGLQIIIALMEGIAEALPEIIQAFIDMIPELVNALMQNLPLLIQAAIQLIAAIIQGLIQAIPQLVRMAPQIVRAIASGIGSALGVLGQTGLQIVQGIWEGISNGFSWIVGKLSGWVDSVIDYIKGLFGIHSPSRVMRDEVGVFLARGIGEGFEDGMAAVKADMINALPTSTDLTSNINYAATGASIRGGILDASSIYEAVRQGASDANINLNGRTMTRELKNMGVAFA